MENISGILIKPDGTKEYYSNGLLHNIDAPAKISSNGKKEWYSNGLLHNVNGPAIIHFDGKMEYYINGILQQSTTFKKDNILTFSKRIINDGVTVQEEEQQNKVNNNIKTSKLMNNKFINRLNIQNKLIKRNKKRNNTFKRSRFKSKKGYISHNDNVKKVYIPITINPNNSQVNIPPEKKQSGPLARLIPMYNPGITEQEIFTSQLYNDDYYYNIHQQLQIV